MGREISDVSVKIGENIRKFRRRRDYTQENMAEELDVSLSTYSRMEKGATPISASQLICLSKILEVPVQEIVDVGQQ